MSNASDTKWFWTSGPTFILFCLMIVAAFIWAGHHFKNFAAVYDGQGMTGEVVERGAIIAADGASSVRIRAKFEDGSIRHVRMTADQWGTCYEGAQLAAKEVDGILYLTTDGCRPVETS